ncbi:MAG: nucleoside recognition protein [Eubacteriales bacterium]|nr:nucleoside recognition protein [Eubacteriales bacterium]
MNYIWCGMLLLGITYGILTGNVQQVTEAAIASSREAISLCITMAGVTAFWVGLMKIAENSGLVKTLASKFRPVLKFLFSRLPEESRAKEYLSLNMISNMLGLGWAATPAGLKAMEALAALEEERRTTDRGVASNEMCTFLIINISSLQLIPVNIIAYRSQYGSVNPTAIVGPGIMATAVSTLVAVVFCKVMDRRKRRV